MAIDRALSGGWRTTVTESQELRDPRHQFTAYMHEGVNTLAKLGYNATRFRQMLLDEGDGVIVAIDQRQSHGLTQTAFGTASARSEILYGARPLENC